MLTLPHTVISLAFQFWDNRDPHVGEGLFLSRRRPLHLVSAAVIPRQDRPSKAGELAMGLV